MSVEARAPIVAAVGVVLLKLVATGGYRSYVLPRTGWLLLAAGVCLFMVALLLAFRPRDRSMVDLAGATVLHGHGSILEGLLVVPIVLLAVVPPAPLGAAAAAMRAGGARPPDRSVFPPLPEGVDGVVSLTVSEFVGRALYDDAGSLRGVRVRLVGFVVPEPNGPAGGFLLARFAMFCCAADAIPVRVRIRGPTAQIPAGDSWLEVVGMWRPQAPLPPDRFDPGMMPTLIAALVRRVPEPADPYDPPF